MSKLLFQDLVDLAIEKTSTTCEEALQRARLMLGAVPSTNEARASMRMAKRNRETATQKA